MEQTLKQRLIGAIVLVSLAVIFIPIILEGPDDEWTPRSHSIPAQPQMDYRADMELELPPHTPVLDETVAMEVIRQEQSESEPQPAVETVKTEAVLATVPEPVKAPEPVKVEPKPAPPDKQIVQVAPKTEPLKGWYVQVGSFGQEMNAMGLRDRLVASGFQVRLQDIELGKKHAYRVLVGPSTSRTTAEKQAQKLQSSQQLKGMVIEYPG
jgi:DedD protein